MIGIYIVLFLVVMWISQWGTERLIARQQLLWCNVWMLVTLIVQCVVIYGIVSELVQHMQEILSLFYD